MGSICLLESPIKDKSSQITGVGASERFTTNLQTASPSPTMGSIPLESPIKSDSFTSTSASHGRFITYWSGPHDARAIAYAERHGISYENDEISSAFDQHKLHQANLAADEETREEHERDTDVDTGTSLAPVKRVGTLLSTINDGIWGLEANTRIQWKKATRGQKLRSCAVLRKQYTDELMRKNGEWVKFDVQLREHGNQMPKKKRQEMDTLESDIQALEDMLAWIDDLEMLVVEENECAWDWRQGIKEQLSIRAEMHACAKVFSWDE